MPNWSIHYPTRVIRVVQDNLSTHSAGALYELRTRRARRILRRLVPYTPSTPVGSIWSRSDRRAARQCLDRRIDDPNWLHRRIDAWEDNETHGRRINWMFKPSKARAKMGRAYPARPKSHNHWGEVLATGG